MDPDLERMVEALSGTADGPCYVHCTQGCELGVVRAGACEHGESINPMAAEDLHAVMAVTLVAGRLSAYYDALQAHGFEQGAALYLTSAAQETMLRLALG
jgi:hypothetical protein